MDNKIPILSVYDKDGNKIPIPAIKGKDGKSITVKSVVESTEPGGLNEITFSDDTVITIRNGTGGSGGGGTDGVSPVATVEQTDTGAVITITDKTGTTTATVYNGTDGYSPVRGTDYWTAADIASIKAYIDDAFMNGEW